MEAFELPEKREKVETAEQARALLAPLREAVAAGRADRFRRVRLSGRSYGVAAAAEAAAAITALRSVEALDLSDIIAGQPDPVVLEVLETLLAAAATQPLREINLSNNALGARGVRACERGLRQLKQLRVVVFNNNGLQVEGAALIRDILLASGAAASLTSFSIYRNLLEDAGASALAPLVAAMPNLQHLCVSATRVGQAGSEALVRALATGASRQLQNLDLSDNTLGAAAGRLLADVLAEQLQLRQLNLADVGVDAAATSAILAALARSAPQLECLDLSGHDISAAQVAALIAVSGATRAREREGPSV
jgi:Ran GTPase-activating protein (RanGAP) involved in mRNA processing and transport